MRFILTIAICLIATTAFGQKANPRLKNFKYGTGKASWWENKQPTTVPLRPQVFYYPPSVRYYYPRPYYGHLMHCYCHSCNQRRVLYQFQINPQRFFFFQFGF